MLKLFKLYILLFLFGSMISSCIEQIELKTTGDQANVVIFGNLNTAGLNEGIQIYRTTSIQNRFEPINGARVGVIDDSGNEGRMFGNSEGIYLLDTNSITIKPGREYYLDISLINGTRYQSIPQRVPLVNAIENIDRRYSEIQSLSDDGVETKKRVFEVIGTTCINNPINEDFYLRWQTIEDYLFFVTDFPDPLSFSSSPPPIYCRTILNEQSILTFSSEGAKVDSLDSKVVAFTDFDNSFRLQHITTTYVHSMTREAYIFWNEVSTLTNATGSIFDIPPGKIKSNLFNVEDKNEEVLGFVEFTNTEFDRMVTFVDDGPYLPPNPCQWSPFKEVEDYPCHCISCLDRYNCTIDRPAIFDE